MTRNTLAPVVSLHHLVRRTTYTDLTPMADVLAAAFHDDPSCPGSCPTRPAGAPTSRR